MIVKAIKTHRIEAGERIEDILDKYITSLISRDIIVITSKILSVCQNRLVPKSTVNKLDLIKQEADAIAEVKKSPYSVYLTIKNNILIPSAGIDESNGDDVYILYPENIQESVVNIWHHLRTRHRKKYLGVLVTDSHTTPTRRGVNGIALGWCGFSALFDYRGKPDLYNKPLRVTQVNIIDALAAAAVLMMGEGNDCTPLALLQKIPKTRFQDRPPTMQEQKAITIPIEEDLYAPLLMATKWSHRQK